MVRFPFQYFPFALSNVNNSNCVAFKVGSGEVREGGKMAFVPHGRAARDVVSAPTHFVLCSPNPRGMVSVQIRDMLGGLYCVEEGEGRDNACSFK